MSDLKFTDKEKIQYSKYIIPMLLQFLKQFSEEPMREKHVEANIQGVFFMDGSTLDFERRTVNFYDHCFP